MSENISQGGIVTQQGQDLTSTVSGDLQQEVNPLESTSASGLPGTTVDNTVLVTDPLKDIEEAFRVKQPLPPPVLNESPTAPQPASPPAEWEKEKAALADQILALQAKLTAVDEFNSDPYGFMAKTAPAIVLKSFDPIKYVQDKINAKYGVRNDEETGEVLPYSPDPKQALIPGTPDYQYVRDLEKFNQEAQSIMQSAQTSVTEQEAKGNQLFENAKQGVMKKYNLTEDSFNQKVWKILETIDNGAALELMADAIMLKEYVARVKENLSNGADRSLPGNINDVPAVGDASLTPDDRAFIKLFGTTAR